MLDSITPLLPSKAADLTATALALAAQGCAVFPLGVSRRPCRPSPGNGQGGHNEASTDPARVRELFAHPASQFIGVATGAASGVDILDLDPRNGSDAWWTENQHRLPLTRVHRSPRGGMHFLFRHAPGVYSCSDDRIHAGVDVKGDGGYAVWHPATGGEVWLDEPVADWPAWLLPLTRRRTPDAAPGAARDLEPPPSVQAVVDLLARMPNPESTSRDEWVAINLAARGCIEALDGEGAAEIGEAVCAWAERWPFEDGTAREKWENDFANAASISSWPTLQRHAARLIPGYAVEAARYAAADEFPPLPPEPAPAPGTLPNILVLPGELHLAADMAEDAIIASGLPIFQRGGMLVRPIKQTVEASGGRETLTAALAELKVTHLVDVLSQVATWHAPDGRSRAHKRIDPPVDVAATLLSRAGFWRMRKVVGVITTPTLRPDGSLLSAPGYDDATQLFHVADATIKLAAEVQTPTRQDAQTALRTLLDLLAEFPFVDDISRAVALSGLITPVVRGAVPLAPLHAMRASTAGSGKSYLVDVISTVCSGRRCPASSTGRSEEELEKRLVGLLLGGYPIASLDNVSGELGGDMLCQAVERSLVRLRPLGGSPQVEVETRWTLFCTGNNLRVRGDMTRRTLMCDLDARMERPELRKFRARPVDLVTDDRGRYVSACLIIVRAYILAGRPGARAPLASYQDWSDVVRSALVWLDCADPAASMEAARRDDPELTNLRAFVQAWHDCYGTDRVLTVKDLVECRHAGDEFSATSPAAADALRECVQCVAGTGGVINPQRLGVWLQKNHGRVVEGCRIGKAPSKRGGVSCWRLERGDA